MAVSTNLEILQVTESQTQKATAANSAIFQLEQALTARLNISTALAVTVDFDVVIPFDDAHDLSSRQALRAIYLSLTSGATEDFNVIHPDNPHLFFCQNDTAQTATVKTAAGSGVELPLGSLGLLYCDGTDVLNITPSISSPPANVSVSSDFEVSFYGKPGDDAILGQFIVGRDTIFPANFSGSLGNAGVNPDDTVTLNVDDDGTLIGNVSISVVGDFTFTTVGGTSKSVAAGSILVVHNQATADIDLADVNLVILGTQLVAQ